MAQFDRPYTIYYWSAIINIALSCTIFELFHARSLKMVLFESMGTVSYSPSIATMAVSLAVSEIFSDK